MSLLNIKKGESNFRLNLTCQDSEGTVIDLTGSTPWFYMGKYTSSTPNYSGQCTISTAVSGTCYIDLTSDATDTAGAYHGEIVIIYTSPAKTVKAQELSINIIPSVHS